MDIDIYIEHLQEMGKVIIHDENIKELQAELLKVGYKTKFKSSDRDYLILISWGGQRENAGRPATGRRKRNFYVTDEEYEKIQKYIESLRA